MSIQPSELLRQADLAIKRRDHFGGARLLEEFLRKYPNDIRAPKVRGSLGELLLSLARHDEAAELLERSIREQGESVRLRFRLGQAYGFLARTDDALAQLDRVLALNPDHEGAIARRAALFQYLGRIEEAAEVLDAAYARGVSGYHMAHAFAGLASRLSKRPEAIARIEPYVHDASLPVPVRAELLFTLGRLHDGEKQYDEAWSAYARANAMLKPRIDISHVDQAVDEVIATYTRDAIISMERAERSAERAVLIVGMPRSGTTLLEQILGAHPDIVPAGELPALPKAVASIPGRMPSSFMPPVRRVRGNALRRANQIFLEAIDGIDVRAERVIDKLPANYCYLGLLPALLPDVHVIHCQRDPLDTCVSCFFRNFAGQHLVYTDLTWIGRCYRNYVRLMRHWQEVLDGILPIHNVDYAEVVTDLEPSARAMVAAVGLPFDRSCLHFERKRRMVPTLEPEQAGRNVYDSSIGRWRNYEKYLGPLIEALGPDLVTPNALERA
ncbi:MAG: sulfotransferase [Phycisphaerales bacterium]|nr:sulfotransferase [Phycisphaerales bacterium]